MTEKLPRTFFAHPKRTLACALGAGVLGAWGMHVGNSYETSSAWPAAAAADTKDCNADPNAYSSIKLDGSQVYRLVGLQRDGAQETVALHGSTQEFTLKARTGSHTMFPDKLEPNEVEDFGAMKLGAVAIARTGSADPTVYVACNLEALTEPGQPLAGQEIYAMPRLHSLQ